MLIHKGEKPFSCVACSGRFRRRHHLMHHKCPKDVGVAPLLQPPADADGAGRAATKRRQDAAAAAKTLLADHQEALLGNYLQLNHHHQLNLNLNHLNHLNHVGSIGADVESEPPPTPSSYGVASNEDLADVDDLSPLPDAAIADVPSVGVDATSHQKQRERKPRETRRLIRLTTAVAPANFDVAIGVGVPPAITSLTSVSTLKKKLLLFPTKCE